MRDLTARLRDIVRQDARPRTPAHAGESGIQHHELTYVPDPDPADPVGAAAELLGGRSVGTDGSCVVIDRLFGADRSHGRVRIEACVPDAEWPIQLFDRRIDGSSDWWRRVVFFDIETTGLSGGAGTIAFLAGCGWFEEGGFRVRQFFLAGPAGERALLRSLSETFRDASLLVTYNGRTFDVPFMETRWAFHRSANPTDDLSHFDMLPPARRLWSRRESRHDDDGGCSLSALERTVLGVHRVGDVPGFEIPARYFHFLRTGDASAMEAVLEHNRSDLVSLAAIMAHALWLAREGPDACREPSEQLAIGRLYESAGETERARGAFERAASTTDADVRRRALSHLAAGLGRDARHDEAAAMWQQVLEMAPEAGRMRSPLERRAAEALAIHHEHRRKDLDTARRYADALERQPGAHQRDVARRISRLQRKLERQTVRLKI